MAVQDSTYTVGRRGVAGNFFVMKAVGAAAERGADLDEVHRIGEKVNSVTRSIGMALTACTPPAKGSPLFDLPEDAVEMGVGIHGEPGRKREKLQSADAMVSELVGAVVDDLPYSSGDRVALMVNGLGGTLLFCRQVSARPIPLNGWGRLCGTSLTNTMPSLSARWAGSSGA